MNASTPIEGLNGAELQRSFLRLIQEQRAMYDSLVGLDVMDQVANVSVEQLTRSILVGEYNITKCAQKICLELGIPIDY